jgi:hypothetical protein
MQSHRDSIPHNTRKSLALRNWILIVIAIVTVLSFLVWALTGPIARSGIAVLLLFLLVLVSGFIAFLLGIVGVIELIVALVADRPTRACIRQLVTAAAIFLVPYCSFTLATSYPELSERRLKGLTASEAIDRLGPPHHVARWYPNGSPPEEVHLIYFRSLWMYSIQLDEDDRVVRVDCGLIPDL